MKVDAKEVKEFLNRIEDELMHINAALSINKQHVNLDKVHDTLTIIAYSIREYIRELE